MIRIIINSIFLLLVLSSFGQEAITINLDNQDQVPLKRSQIESDLLIESNFSSIVAKKESTKSGDFYTLEIEGLTKQFGEGQPDIPVISKLIEVPGKNSFSFSVEGYNAELINLSDHQIFNKIAPAQPSVNKNADTEKLNHFFNEEIYYL